MGIKVGEVRKPVALPSLSIVPCSLPSSLSVNPTQELADDATKFNAFKSKWINLKCTESSALLTAAYVTSVQSNALNISLLESTAEKLCAGPKFTEYQSNELTKYLSQMQTIFTETQVCLPQHFDVCTNLDRIWSFTYVRTPENDYKMLDLTNVMPHK